MTTTQKFPFQDFWGVFEAAGRRGEGNLNDSLDLNFSDTDSDGPSRPPKRSRNSSKSNLYMSEVERFLSLPREQRNSDPIEWWESHKDEFKLLVPMALQYLCTPPSSVDSERLFSSAKQVYTDNRNRLGTDIAEKLIFIMRNDRKV